MPRVLGKIDKKKTNKLIGNCVFIYLKEKKLKISLITKK